MLLAGRPAWGRLRSCQRHNACVADEYEAGKFLYYEQGELPVGRVRQRGQRSSVLLRQRKTRPDGWATGRRDLLHPERSPGAWELPMTR